eukprot:Skav213778  [mRNA]  locus=scaffold3228:155526:159578:+ [translate_table: standard]
MQRAAPWDAEATALVGAIEQYNGQQGFREVKFITRERQKQAPERRRENVSDWLADELTILGAWDYAVSDPDGLLGGATLVTSCAVNPDEVGLMGFDYGGFSAQRAFALEPQIPALLLDGVVHNFKVLMDAKVKEVFQGVPGLQPLFTSQVSSLDFAQRSAANKSYILMIRSSEEK